MTYLDPLRLVGLGPVRLLPLWRAEPVPLATGLAPARASPTAAAWLPLAGWLTIAGGG